jgi:signal transduction histidine kinase/DNA-binding response OmpR family regulator
MASLFQKFVALGQVPDDPEEEKLRKSSLLVVSGPFSVAGLIWGLLYYSHGLVVPGSIPFIYGILSIGTIVSFSITKKYQFFRNSQLFLILLLPFTLQISLGGFVPSSAVIYWAIVAPAGAMFFDSVRRSLYWFGAYILLVVIAYLVNDIIPEYVNWDLPENFVNALFLMNIIGVSGIVFSILYYFVGKITNLNAALEEQSEKLKEMDKVKSRFFANISHEFRTPLTLILGLLSKQKSDPMTTVDNRKKSIAMMRNAQRLMQLINQLLDLSKLESGEQKIQASKGDIVLFTKVLSSQFESMAAERNIQVLFNMHNLDGANHQEPVELFFDDEKVQKVLTNLISNAVKFTPQDGKIAIEVKTSASTEAPGIEYADIIVSNTGDGIPQDKLIHVFDRFYQVDDSSNREYEGSGIGLALVKELTELHRGKVSVESNLGTTSFTVQLPLNDGYLREDEKVDAVPHVIEDEISLLSTFNTQEASGANSDAKEQDSEPGNNEQLEILIVEDNHDLREMIRDILQEEYRVYEAVDGVDGMEKAESAIPDLVISDVMMPRMNGYDLCKGLKTNSKTNHIPVILLTAKASKENKLEGLETGADDYLVKPFDQEELLIRIKNLIAIRENLQKKYQGESLMKPVEVKATSVQQKFLQGLKEVIESNLDNDQFGVDDLGREMAMSRSQVHRKLKAMTDQSATTFMRNYRLHRAADLLKQDAGNVTEIAYQVGFNSQTYFSSSFSELFNCSPSEYKQRVDGGETLNT